MITDPIGDCFTRIRNGLHARREQIDIPYSRLKENILNVLKREGFLSSVQAVELTQGRKNLTVRLKYDSKGAPVLEHLKRVSRPGQRVYESTPEESRVRSGLGIQILSTPRGVMTDREAKEQKVGGEVVGEAW